MQGFGQIQGRLPAKLDDHAHGLFRFRDVEHILLGQGFEIEFVRCVIVRAHGFRVAVHHDAFHALLAEREGRMHTAVVEFNALADPVGAAAQNDHLFPVGHPGFAFLFIGRIVIGGGCLELGRTGVNQLVSRTDVQGFPAGGNLVLFRAAQIGDLYIGKAP